MIDLTKDADTLICLIYAEYLNRRKTGVDKRQAKNFANTDNFPVSFKRKFSEDDIKATLPELKRAGMIRLYINSGFVLEDSGIIYMEKRFPNGISQVLDWLSKIISVAQLF